MNNNDYYDKITKTDEPYNLAAGISGILLFLSLVALVVVLITVSQPLVPAIIVGSIAGGCLFLTGVFGFIGKYKRNQEITDRYNEDRQHIKNIDNKIYNVKQQQNYQQQNNQFNQNINNKQQNYNNNINNQQSGNDLNKVNQQNNNIDINKQ